MTEMAVDDTGPMLRVVPPMTGGVEVRTLRARCTDCGAHAAVVTAGASMTGACSVCGSGMLELMDEHLPPPRRWVL